MVFMLIYTKDNRSVSMHFAAVSLLNQANNQGINIKVNCNTFPLSCQPLTG